MIWLSIVMPALTQRIHRCVIAEQLEEQAAPFVPEVELLFLTDNGRMTTGEKLNLLYGMAGGRYICAVGDDDTLQGDYVPTLLDAVKNNDGVDTVTFHHTWNVDGEYRALTIQRLGVPERQIPGTPTETHYRLPSPLCPVKADIAKRFSFPHARDKEDVAYKQWLKANLSTSFDVPRVLYHHTWLKQNKNERQGLSKKWKG